MKTYSSYNDAKDELQASGGVLLVTAQPNSDNTAYGYTVCEFREAVDIREGLGDRYVMAEYWAKLAEAGYDETEIIND